MIELLSRPETYVSLLTLTALEVVLGIDNIIFIAILTGKLPPEQRPMARQVGLSLALGMRIGLLFAIAWVMKLTNPLFEVAGQSFSGRDLILLFGGLFLVAKSAHEIYDKVEAANPLAPQPGHAAFGWILVQILALDVIFSLDSVITAVGMARDIPVMIAAMVISVAVMLAFAGRIGDFVHKHPSMKVLALAFLMLIGVMLIAEALGQHVSRGTIYFSMAFALAIELINMRVRKGIARSKAVEKDAA